MYSVANELDTPIWVPSILAFGIYLKLLNNPKNDWNNPIFRRAHYIIIRNRLYIGIKRNEKTKILNATSGPPNNKSIHAIFYLIIKPPLNI